MYMFMTVGWVISELRTSVNIMLRMHSETSQQCAISKFIETYLCSGSSLSLFAKRTFARASGQLSFMHTQNLASEVMNTRNRCDMNYYNNRNDNYSIKSVGEWMQKNPRDKDLRASDLSECASNSGCGSHSILPQYLTYKSILVMS